MYKDVRMELGLFPQITRTNRKNLETTWNGRVINHIIHHVTYKTIMLKKTGKLLLCQKNQKNFRQIISFVARSDPGKFL